MQNQDFFFFLKRVALYQREPGQKKREAQALGANYNVSLLFGTREYISCL
jgi:hypothetical protein